MAMVTSRFLKIEFKGKRHAFFSAPDDNDYTNDSFVILTDNDENDSRIGKIVDRLTVELAEDELAKLPQVSRAATPEEIEQYLKNREDENEAARICRKQIEIRSLQMKLIDVSIRPDGSKITFFFTAERRVDFRDLVKGLAGIFKTRIELRQVGIRDETKLLDGFGPCGRRLCCSSFLKDFSPITLKMARDQHISLTPSKISGVCGRLLCCLEYEHKVYKEKTKLFPTLESRVRTKDGITLLVKAIDIFKDAVIGVNNDGVEMRVSLHDIKAKSAKSEYSPDDENADESADF